MAMTTTVPVPFRTVDGVLIRYADSGGSREPAVLLTSPADFVWEEAPAEYESIVLESLNGRQAR